MVFHNALTPGNFDCYISRTALLSCYGAGAMFLLLRADLLHTALFINKIQETSPNCSIQRNFIYRISLNSTNVRSFLNLVFLLIVR